MYFDINRQIDIDLMKLGAIIQHAKDADLFLQWTVNPGPPHSTTCSPTEEGEHWKNI